MSNSGVDLSATYAPVAVLARRATNLAVFAGDSITTGASASDAGAGLAFAGGSALGLMPVGQLASGPTYVDAGVGGDTSSLLLARFGTDVIAKSPKLVVILIGTNDASADVPLSTFAANMRAMVAQCVGINAQVVLCTVPPNGSGAPADRKARIVAYNQWLCRFAIANGFPVADFYRATVDPENGNYLAGYGAADFTHPTPVGIGVMAAELVAAMARPLSAGLLLTKDANDPWNFTQNALFLSAFGTGWSAPTAGATGSLVTGDPTIQGNWGKISVTGSSAPSSTYQNQTATQGGTGFTAGNHMMFGCRIQSSALSLNMPWHARLRSTDGTYDLGTASEKIVYMGNGGLIFLMEGAAAPTVSYIQSEADLAAGTGDMQLAQFTTYDLTAMGVTDVNGVLA